MLMGAIVLSPGIGFVAGLRGLTAPALVSWAAHLGWLRLEGTPLAFLGSTIAVAIFTVLALGEYVTDLLPKTPPRTAPPSLIARLVTGALSGACVGVSGGASLLLGAVLGAIGAVIGTFGGYKARTGLVKALNVKDIFIAIPEDLIAIGLGYLLVSQ
jgi:uncharacterized membrane protein